MESPSTSRRAVLIGVLGAVATGVALASVFGWSTTPDPVLGEVPIAELSLARQTLATDAASATEEASCSSPLAYVMVWATDKNSNGSIQLQSGRYLSPAFQPSTEPRRIAIPYPGPYELGHGTIAVVGMADGIMVALTPVWRIDSFTGKLMQNVIWTPRSHC